MFLLVFADVWSVGCVFAELLLGRPLFCGESSVDQLVEIIKVLGTPTPDEIMGMNPNYTEFKFPTVRGVAWSRVRASGALVRITTNSLVVRLPTTGFPGVGSS